MWGILLVATSLLGVLDVASAEYVDPAELDACPGYSATNVKVSGPTLTATLALAGAPCNVFGSDIKTLDLAVTYETGGLAPSPLHRLATNLCLCRLLLLSY